MAYVSEDKVHSHEIFTSDCSCGLPPLTLGLLLQNIFILPVTVRMLKDMANFLLDTHNVLHFSWVSVTLALTSTKHSMQTWYFFQIHWNELPSWHSKLFLYLVVFLKIFLSVNELFLLTVISSYFQHFLMHVHNYTFHISENNNDLTGSWNASWLTQGHVIYD